MTGRDLSEKLNYTGMERGVRKLALEDKLAKPEEIAVMSEIEVCDLIVEKYDIAFAENECIGLVKKDDAKEFYKMLKLIER